MCSSDLWMARAYEAEGKLRKAEARIMHLEATAQVLVKEALDGLAEDAEIDVRLGVEGGDNLRAQNAEAVIDAATIYRDTEYPEETP